jgi:hypothetical protein
MLCSKKSWNLSYSVLTGLTLGAVVISLGCAERPAPVASNEASSGSTPAVVASGTTATSVATAPLSEVVVGTWLGQAMLDESALEQKLEQLPAAEQERVFVIAENFLSTVMAMDDTTLPMV